MNFYYIFTAYSIVKASTRSKTSNPRLLNNFRKRVNNTRKIRRYCTNQEGEYKSLTYKLVSIARVITDCENSITVSRREWTGHVRRGLTRADRFWSTSQSSVIARGNVESGTQCSTFSWSVNRENIEDVGWPVIHIASIPISLNALSKSVIP